MKRLLTLTAAMALAMPLAAMAQQAERSPAPEARSAAAGASAIRDDGQLFDRLDANRDGYLSAEELAREPADRENWIALDRNRDGRIGRDEFTGVRLGERAGAE